MLKVFLLSFFSFLFAFLLHAQQAQFGVSTGLDFPLKTEMPRAKVNTGIYLFFNYNPFPSFPVHFEFQTGWASSYSTKRDQFYYTDYPYGFDARVTYANRFNRSLIGAKIFANYSFNSIRPYVKPQIGWGKMKTKMKAVNPANEEDPTLENRTTFKDLNWVYGLETGIQVDLVKLFPKTVSEEGQALNLSFHYLGSFRAFEYTDLRQIEDRPGYEESYLYGGPPVERDIDYPYAVVSSESIFEQKIAQTHTTRLSAWGIQLSYVLTF